MRASLDDADVVLAAIEGLSDDELNDCPIEGGIRQAEVGSEGRAVEFTFTVGCGGPGVHDGESSCDKQAIEETPCLMDDLMTDVG